MTRHQAQSAQIQQARQSLVEAHGPKAVAIVDQEIDRLIASDIEALAKYGWHWQWRDVPDVYAYGKMVIAAHFERKNLTNP